MIPKSAIKLILIFSFLVTQAFGQEKAYNGDPDASFASARNLAFNQQRKQAQDTLVMILTKYPDYHDVRNFLATTYSWDGDYKKAKKEFEITLEKDSKNKEAWAGTIQNELWAGTPFIALEKSEQALKLLPKDQDILLLKAKAQENTNDPLDALTTVKSILDENPENQKAKEFKNTLKRALSLNTIGVLASADFYSDVFDPMQYYSLKYSRQTRYGSFSAKLNFNRKFNTNGEQFEIDMYPKIVKGLYGYINAGYSNSNLFPKTKYGAELFKSLPKGFEASLGFRALNYSTTTMIYTGSAGWYTGNSYWMFRSYVTPGDVGASVSGAVTYRKYRSDADNYFSVSAGMGYSPEVNQFNYSSAEQVKFGLKSQKANFGYYFTSPNKRHAYGSQLGVTHQEKIFSPGEYYWVYFLALSWDLRFK
ncbi:MAG: YaiO family outer membrane beta-barrel protein [Flavobacterium sp.]